MDRFIALSLSLVIATFAGAAPIPITFNAPIDNSSNITWSLTLNIETSPATIISAVPNSPAGLSSPLGGTLSGTFDPVTNQLAITTGSIVQPVRPFLTLDIRGNLQTVFMSMSAGLSNPPTDSFGGMQMGNFFYETDFTLNGFNPDEQVVGPVTNLGAFAGLMGTEGSLTYGMRGSNIFIPFPPNPLAGSGTVNVDLPLDPFTSTASFRLLSLNEVELSFPINRTITFDGFSFGGNPASASVVMQGIVRMTATFVPEASTFAMMSLVGTGLIGTGTYKRWKSR